MRLQLVKQGIHDQTMLMPNNHTVNITDNNDGTYNVDITLIKIAANIKKAGRRMTMGAGELVRMASGAKAKDN